MEYLLETQEVVKQYANHLALDHVSIQVPEGQILVCWDRMEPEKQH